MFRERALARDAKDLHPISVLFFVCFFCCCCFSCYHTPATSLRAYTHYYIPFREHVVIMSTDKSLGDPGMLNMEADIFNRSKVYTCVVVLIGMSPLTHVLECEVHRE